MIGYSQSLQREVLVAITCKRWGCRFCGEQKIKKHATIAADAEPTKLITLTVNNNLHAGPREAYDATRRKIPDLVKRIRKAHGEFEFMRVLEITKAGWPHYHFIARCSYIPQSWLSDQWNILTGAPIVDVRKIKRPSEAYFYVMKYLGKQRYIHWTNRRVTFSRGYAVKSEDAPRLSLDMLMQEFHGDHPDDFLRWNCSGQAIEQISTLVFGFLGAISPEHVEAAAAQSPASN
jgi:hypothetical protein